MQLHLRLDGIALETHPGFQIVASRVHEELDRVDARLLRGCVRQQDAVPRNRVVDLAVQGARHVGRAGRVVVPFWTKTPVVIESRTVHNAQHAHGGTFGGLPLRFLARPYVQQLVRRVHKPSPAQISGCFAGRKFHHDLRGAGRIPLRHLAGNLLARLVYDAQIRAAGFHLFVVEALRLVFPHFKAHIPFPRYRQAVAELPALFLRRDPNFKRQRLSLFLVIVNLVIRRCVQCRANRIEARTEFLDFRGKIRPSRVFLERERPRFGRSFVVLVGDRQAFHRHLRFRADDRQLGRVAQPPVLDRDGNDLQLRLRDAPGNLDRVFRPVRPAIPVVQYGARRVGTDLRSLVRTFASVGGAFRQRGLR